MNSNPPILTLAIPALNESSIIIDNVVELKSWMAENLPETTFEILIINDGSTDGMGALLEEKSAEDPNLRVVHHPYNMGRGRAIRTAMNSTNSDFLIALDADLSYSPEHILPMLETLQTGSADMVLASPYHPDGKVENVPFVRAAMSRLGNLILKGSFQSEINTVTCVVRGYARQVIDHLELVNSGKDLHLEILYKAEILGFRIKEIPAKLIWRDRKRGQTKQRGLIRFFDFSIFKMRNVILSHVLFNFIAKPKLVFLGPILLGLIASLYGSGSLFLSFADKLMNGQAQPLRQTFVEGELTLILTLVSFILSVFILFFLFIASQAKQYFEEQYILSVRNNYLLKQLQQKTIETMGND